jgi:hypothetical protein
MVVDPLHIDFDVLRLGEEDLESIWVSNAGTGPLDLFEVVLDGAGAYSLVSVPPLPYSLDPGDWVELQVGYAAEEARDEGKVTVRGSDEASPEQVVGLVGALVVPALAIDPLAVTFGELPPLCEEHSTVTLRSVGSAPLTIESIGLEGEAYTLSDPPALPVTLDPDDAVVVEVTVLPLDEREYAGTLAVGSDDPAGVAVATFETTGKEGVSCDGYTKTDVSIVADHGRVDVALLIDTTASMGPAVAALASEFASIAGAVGLRLPDATFGVGTFDDYNQLPFGSGDDKPFVLRQQQTG